MRILIACEESQRVCIAFRKRGHEAYSCDLLECSGGHPEWHIRRDVLSVIQDGWDMMIAFPPCTYLTNAGINWFSEHRYGDKARERKRFRLEAMSFVFELASAPIPHIAIENPVGYLNTNWRPADQIIEPFWFGDTERKRTCLWLKNLPPLVPTDIVEPIVHAYFKTGPKKGQPIYFTKAHGRTDDRALLRSKTFPGIARAMADQWSEPVGWQIALPLMEYCEVTI